MKKVMISLLIGLIIGGGAVYMFQDKIPLLNRGTSQPVASSGKTSFDAVTAKLDKGGTLYMYCSTEGVIKFLDEFAQKLGKIIAAEAAKNEQEKAQAPKIFNFVYGLCKHSGFMEISGIGASSVQVEPGLNHSKVAIHHYAGKGQGLIWNMLDARPHNLDELDLLPADTALAGFSDLKLMELWEWLKKEVQAAELPELQKSILTLEPMLKAQGMPMEKLLGGLGGRIGIILTLDKNIKSKVPTEKSMFEFPEPAIALVLTVKDDFIFNLLQSKIKMAEETGDKNIRTIKIPVPPLPVLVNPVIVQTGGLLIFASNERLVNTMLEAKAKGNGLTSTDEFKRMSAHMPKKGNRFGYVGAALSQTIRDIQEKAIQAGGESQNEAKELFNLFRGDEAWTVYSVVQHNEDGLLIDINHSMAMESMVLIPALAVGGVVAAIAVPNMLTAVQKGKQKATMGDMKSISMAIESYIAEHGEAPQGTTLTELQAKLQPTYIKTLPLKDAWGNDFLYRHGTGDKKSEYAVGSGGKDGIFNGWEQQGSYIVAGTSHFDNDIILSGGQFTYSPEIK